MAKIDITDLNTFVKYTDDVTPVSAEFLEALAVQWDNGEDAANELANGDLLLLDRSARENTPGTSLATALFGLASHEVSAVAGDGRWFYIASSDGAGANLGVRRVERETLTLSQNFPPLTETITVGTRMRMATNGDLVAISYGEHVELFNVTSAPFVSQWTFSTDVEIRAIAIDQDNVYISHTRDGSNLHVRAIANSTGVVAWSEDLGVGVGAQNFIASDGELVYFGGDEDASGVNVHGRTTAAGAFAYSKKLVGDISCGALSHNALWVCDDNTLYRLRPGFDDLVTEVAEPLAGSVPTAISATENVVALVLSTAISLVNANNGNSLGAQTLTGAAKDVVADAEYTLAGHAVASSVNCEVVDNGPDVLLCRVNAPATDTKLAPRQLITPVHAAPATRHLVLGQLGTTSSKSFSASGSEETITVFDEELAVGAVVVDQSTGEITVLESGLYRIAFTFTAGAAGGTGGGMTVSVEQNAAQIGLSQTSENPAGESSTFGGSKLVNLNDDDVITMRFNYNATAVSVVQATLLVERICNQA